MKLIYCATPSRLAGHTESIMDYVSTRGLGPFHPFQAFQLDRFENGPVGRDQTMNFCCRAIQICDEFWLFGVSEGTLQELQFVGKLNEARLKKPVVFVPGFDPDWEIYWNQLRGGLESFQSIFPCS